MKPHTVIGYVGNTGKLFTQHVLAVDPDHAVERVAKANRGTPLVFICTLPGYRNDVALAGECPVYSESILENLEINQ